MVEIRKADTFEKNVSLPIVRFKMSKQFLYSVITAYNGPYARYENINLQTSHEVQVLNNRTYRDNILLF